MEISGSIRSFITNHKRFFEENAAEIARIQKTTTDNRSALGTFVLDAEAGVLESIRKFSELSYATAIASSQALDDFDALLLALNTAIADYNYEVNQVNSAKHLKLSLVNKLSRMPAFPDTAENMSRPLSSIVDRLLTLSKDKPDHDAVVSFLTRSAKRLSRSLLGKQKRYEDRLTAFLVKKFGSALTTQEAGTAALIEHLGQQVIALEGHFARKPYDGASRGKYFELLALRARLAHPELITEINTLVSEAKGHFFKGKAQTEIITIPGFSWDKGTYGKPLKLAALAFKGKQLYICIASSSSAFTIRGDTGQLRFVKTTGGQKKRNSAPKTIEYIDGSFQTTVANDVPLLLQLHFGKSYARRYLFNKQWGLFSKSPKIFLNNARIKRQKVNPGDPWIYYLDVSMSAERVYGFKDFARGIITAAECVIGIDRREAKPIAYAVVKIKDGETLEHGFLASSYIEKLNKYDAIKRDYQSKGRIFPKFLRSKILRLQDTLLETASSEILALVAKHKGVVILENLSGRFPGVERSIIPKKTYKKVETLVRDSLQLSGLLRVDNHGSFWGALKTVFPGGTSQTCIQCGQVWNKEFKVNVIRSAKEEEYRNIDFAKKTVQSGGKVIQLHDSFTVFNYTTRHNEVKHLSDLQASIQAGNPGQTERYLNLAMGPRIAQDTFICGLCGYKEDTDIVGAINIARRGATLIQKPIQN
jgi:hypothetical protein